MCNNRGLRKISIIIAFYLARTQYFHKLSVSKNLYVKSRMNKLAELKRFRSKSYFNLVVLCWSLSTQGLSTLKQNWHNNQWSEWCHLPKGQFRFSFSRQILYAQTLFFIKQRYVNLKKILISNFQIELILEFHNSKVKLSLSVWSGWAEKVKVQLENPTLSCLLQHFSLALLISSSVLSFKFLFCSIYDHSSFQTDSWTLQLFFGWSDRER